MPARCIAIGVLVFLYWTAAEKPASPARAGGVKSTAQWVEITH